MTGRIASILLMGLFDLVATVAVIKLLYARFRRRILSPIRILVERLERAIAGAEAASEPGAGPQGNELEILLARLEKLLAEVSRRDAALEKRSQELEMAVAQRTLELSTVNRQLAESLEEVRSSMEAAQAASRTKSDFLAQMSHEIRTPMYGMLGMTELLTNTELSAEQTKYVETVRRSGEALLSIINNILDISKIEAGKMELECISFDLRETVAEAVELLAEDAQKKGLELVFQMDASLPRIFCGDPGRLRQIVVNLTANAVKFTQQGRVTVQVDMVREPDVVRVTVSDTGIGISAEAQEHIFDQFSQADQSITRRYGGTGLGLAIARQLTELMGGEISVQSEPGKGSTFSFTAHLEPDTSPSASPQESALSGKRVLIVETGSTDRALLLRQSTAWGMEAEVAKDIAHALRMVESAPFDLVIVAQELAGYSGIEVARMARSKPMGRSLRIVMLTSGGALPDSRLLLDSGISSCLAKPVQQSSLYAALVEALGMELPSGWQSGKTSPSLTAPRVLLVEDNEVNQEVGRGMLESLGCSVDIAHNGFAALEAVEKARYSLVFMDCQMPEMDGLEATRRIRAWEKESARGSGRPDAGPGASSSRTPIVSLTAFAMQGDREVCLAAGADDYLTKPFTRTQLCRMLDKHLRPPEEAPVEVPQQAATEGADHAVLQPHASSALEMIRTLPGKKGVEVLRKVVQLYLDSTPTLLETLREAQLGGDAEKLKAAAHSFKSSSANLGAVRLAQACGQLEALGRAGSTQGALPILLQVEQEYSAVRDALSGGSLC